MLPACSNHRLRLPGVWLVLTYTYSTRLGPRSNFVLPGQDIVLRVPAESEDVLQQDMSQLLKAALQKPLVRAGFVSLVILFCLSAQSELEKARGHAATEQTAMQTL